MLNLCAQPVDAHNLEGQLGSFGRASNETLVNALAMMAPFDAAEKQALLEAPERHLRARARRWSISPRCPSPAISGGPGRTLQ